MNDSRPTWDEYFMQVCHVVSNRSTCDRGKVGCIIVKDKRIMTTGYSGAPSGLPHCDEVGHLMKTVIETDGSKGMHCVRTTHAEANAIAQAAKYGVSVDGATLYCKMEPCLDCTKLIINSGIKKVICEKRYHAADQSRKFFKQAGVELVVLNDELEKYPDQKIK